MLTRDFRSLVAAAALLAGACGGTPSISIQAVGSPKPTAIEVRGLPSSDLRALAGANLSEREWQEILTVTVGSGPGQPLPDPANRLPMAGDYRVDGSVVRFTPMFGFDAGRAFGVRFDPAKIPGAEPTQTWRQHPVSAIIGVAAPPRTSSTTVTQVYPSGPELPENTLRFYIEFSAPMGRGEALPHIRLVDDSGTDVVDPFLPVEAEFWSPDRRRFTLFFDPGRVKRGIKPNRDLGRALVVGRRYALVIDNAWLDGTGAPLQSAHRHEFTATAAVERPLDQQGWRVDAPAAGSRDPLRVTFPWALDHGLLQRAIRLMRENGEVRGDVRIEAGEQRWSFIPAEAWTKGEYVLEMASELEDPAGNRLGRAFEVMVVTSPPERPARRSITIQ